MTDKAIRLSSKSNNGLNGGDLDTLYQLWLHGPREDGEVPSKTSRDHLIVNGYARRIKEPWATTLTIKGKFAYWVWRKIKVRI